MEKKGSRSTWRRACSVRRRGEGPCAAQGVAGRRRGRRTAPGPPALAPPPHPIAHREVLGDTDSWPHPFGVAIKFQEGLVIFAFAAHARRRGAGPAGPRAHAVVPHAEEAVVGVGEGGSGCRRWPSRAHGRVRARPHLEPSRPPTPAPPTPTPPPPSPLTAPSTRWPVAGPAHVGAATRTPRPPRRRGPPTRPSPFGVARGGDGGRGGGGGWGRKAAGGGSGRQARTAAGGRARARVEHPLARPTRRSFAQVPGTGARALDQGRRANGARPLGDVAGSGGWNVMGGPPPMRTAHRPRPATQGPGAREAAGPGKDRRPAGRGRGVAVWRRAHVASLRTHVGPFAQPAPRPRAPTPPSRSPP